MSARAQNDEEVSAYVQRKQPLAAGFLEADTVASAAAFLLSDEAAMITGQVLAVDGGWEVTEVGG
jgi:enoyl-[acyl-carrier-protein] reductase (NADH)